MLAAPVFRIVGYVASAPLGVGGAVRKARPLMSVAAVEKSKAEQFGERTFQIINDAGLALMMSVGHRTRLFDIMSTLAASTAAELAESAGSSASATFASGLARW